MACAPGSQRAGEKLIESMLDDRGYNGRVNSVNLSPANLTPEARAALDTALRTGRDHQVVLYEHCHTGRWRLAVRYVRVDASGEEPIDLGLLWSEDQAALERLRGDVEREIAGHAR
jgi:hypothetical protein